VQVLLSTKKGFAIAHCSSSQLSPIVHSSIGMPQQIIALHTKIREMNKANDICKNVPITVKACVQGDCYYISGMLWFILLKKNKADEHASDW